MELKRRGRQGIYHVRFTAPDGSRIHRSTRTSDKVAAQEFADRLKAELWRIHHLGQRPRRSWQDAAVRWLKETSHKRTHHQDRAKLRQLDPYLGALMLDEISADRLRRIADALAPGRSPATVNRFLALIRAILRRAAGPWDWIDKAPHAPMRAEPPGREFYLNREQAGALVAALEARGLAHTATLARFALATGMRAGNVLSLEWSQVDLDRRVCWVTAAKAKAKRAISVPLNRDAVVILRGESGKHRRWVFTYRGRRIGQIMTRAWYQTVAKAGFKGLRFHDLRHTWASWHVMSGTPLPVLQELGGWADYSMVLRYAHLSPAHVAGYADNVSSLRPVESAKGAG